MMDQHLDAEAIGRWMAGERGPAAEDHLRDCAECRAEVARLESALAHFRDAAHQWSGWQPLSRPPARWAVGSLARRRWPAPMRWAAVTAVAALLAGFPVYRNYRQRQAVAQAKANALLLEEVSADISRPAPEPLEPLIKLVSQSATGDTQ
jgi:hypothetical protein